MTGPSLIQHHNIERTLNDHLWDEIVATRERKQELMAQVTALAEREQRLVRIADAAGLREPLPVPAILLDDAAHTTPRTET